MACASVASAPSPSAASARRPAWRRSRLLRNGPGVTALAVFTVRPRRQAPRPPGSPAVALHKRSLCKLAAAGMGAACARERASRGLHFKRRVYAGKPRAAPRVASGRTQPRERVHAAPSRSLRLRLARRHAGCASPLRGGSRRAAALALRRPPGAAKRGKRYRAASSRLPR